MAHTALGSAIDVVGVVGAVVGRMALHALGELVGPSRCASCACPVAQGLALPAVFCATCASSVHRLVVPPLPDATDVDDVAPDGLDGDFDEPDRSAGQPAPLRAFAAYSGAMAEAIRRYKYGGHVELARPLGDLLRGVARAAAPGRVLVVPVPLHPRRLAERGYDQVALLSAAVARELGAPHGVRALRRSRHTPRQAELDREARRSNVEAAFELGADVAGRRVLLVDDVSTTGSTLAACVTALRRGGAHVTGALVLARTPTGDGETE